MPCSNCGNGSFQSVNWIENSNEVILENNVHVFFLQSGGENIGVAVTKVRPDGTTRRIEASAGGGTPSFAVWGNPRIYLAIRIIRPVGAADLNRTIAIIDTEDLNLFSTIVVNETLGVAQSEPFLLTCPGDGSIIYAGSPGSMLNERRDLGLYVANGRTNLDSAGSEIFDGTLTAKAFSDSFRVVRGNNDDDTVLFADRPLGLSNFTDENSNDISSLVFGALTVGATESLQFNIENNGDNCLKIDSIVNAPPFTVSPFISNRTLLPGEVLPLTVTFRPTDRVSYNRSIEIKGPTSNTLVNGDNKLICTGNGTSPDVVFNGNKNFSKVPVSGSKTRSFQIENTSDIAISFNGPASQPGKPFRWNAFSGTLQAGQVSPAIAVTFVSPLIAEPFPPVIPRPFEQSHKQVINFNTNPNTGTNAYTLRATACLAQPLIKPDPFVVSLGLKFGEIITGVKRMKPVIVQNPGNASLHYSAQIVPVEPGDFGSEMMAQMFNLQQTNDSDEVGVKILTDLSAKPVSPCGNLENGNGSSVFHVSLRGVIAGPAEAILEIYDHNVLNGSALDKYSILLSGTILPILSDD